MSEAKLKLSPLEEWARTAKTPHVALKVNYRIEGALWLLEQAREWCDEWTAVDGDIKLCHLTALELLQYLEMLCGREAKS